MTRSSNARRLLCSSVFLFTLTAGAAGRPVYPTLDCGTYVVSGTLKHGAAGHYYLAVRDKSTSRFELILLGGNFHEKFLHERTRVKAEVYVPKAITDFNEPFVFLEKFLPERPSADEIDSVRLTSKEPCGQKAKYVKE